MILLRLLPLALAFAVVHAETAELGPRKFDISADYDALRARFGELLAQLREAESEGRPEAEIAEIKREIGKIFIKELSGRSFASAYSPAAISLRLKVPDLQDFGNAVEYGKTKLGEQLGNLEAAYGYGKKVLGNKLEEIGNGIETATGEIQNKLEQLGDAVGDWFRRFGRDAAHAAGQPASDKDFKDFIEKILKEIEKGTERPSYLDSRIARNTAHAAGQPAPNNFDYKAFLEKLDKIAEEVKKAVEEMTARQLDSRFGRDTAADQHASLLDSAVPLLDKVIEKAYEDVHKLTPSSSSSSDQDGESFFEKAIEAFKKSLDIVGDVEVPRQNRIGHDKVHKASATREGKTLSDILEETGKRLREQFEQAEERRKQEQELKKKSAQIFKDIVGKRKRRDAAGDEQDSDELDVDWDALIDKFSDKVWRSPAAEAEYRRKRKEELKKLFIFKDLFGKRKQRDSAGDEQKASDELAADENF